jgi:hypothetical protein
LAALLQQEQQRHNQQQQQQMGVLVKTWIWSHLQQHKLPASKHQQQGSLAVLLQQEQQQQGVQVTIWTLLHLTPVSPGQQQQEQVVQCLFS